MNARIIAFGIVKDFFNDSSLDIELEDGISVANFKTQLESRFPQLKKLNSYMIAVNEEYAVDTDIIKQEDEIAIIPPVTGG